MSYTPSSSSKQYGNAPIKPMEEIFSADQILVPPSLPTIMKNYTKEVIRFQPKDITAFSYLYFQAITDGELDDFIKNVAPNINDATKFAAEPEPAPAAEDPEAEESAAGAGAAAEPAVDPAKLAAGETAEPVAEAPAEPAAETVVNDGAALAKQVSELFATLDKNGNGFLCFSEINSWVRSGENQLQALEGKSSMKVCKLLNKDGDAKVTEEEFSEAATAMLVEEGSQALAGAMSSEVDKGELRALFEELDKDGSDRVEVAEFVKGLRKKKELLKKFFGSDMGIGAIFKMCDVDNTSYLSWAEFEAGVAKSSAAAADPEA